MRSRNLLHKNKLDDFKLYVIARNLEIQVTNGEYEVLRVRPMHGKAPMIFFERINSDHITGQGAKAVQLIEQYIKDKKERTWNHGKLQ